jgi:hypothetical protein
MAGLVSKGREAQWRPCTLNAEPLNDAAAWMDEYRVHMEASLDRLGEYLKTVTHPATKTESNSAADPTPESTDDATRTP